MLSTLRHKNGSVRCIWRPSPFKGEVRRGMGEDCMQMNQVFNCSYAPAWEHIAGTLPRPVLFTDAQRPTP